MTKVEKIAVASSILIFICLITFLGSFLSIKLLEKTQQDLVKKTDLSDQKVASDTVKYCTDINRGPWDNGRSTCMVRTVSYYNVTDFNHVIDSGRAINSNLTTAQQNQDLIMTEKRLYATRRKYSDQSIQCSVDIDYPFNSLQSKPYRYLSSATLTTLMVIVECSTYSIVRLYANTTPDVY